MISGNLKPTTPKQWIKLALIPVLSIVLLGVLWQQPKAKTAAVPTDAATPQTPSTTDATVPPASTQPEVLKPTWPKARLEDVIAFNPFEREQVSDSEDETVEAGDQKSVNGIGGGQSRTRLVSSVKLQAIFIDGQGAAAILDSQVIHVGDTLPSGGRVVEITAQGIKLEGP